MDPATAGIASSFAQGLGGSLNKSAGPSDAILNGESSFDSSGWNVTFGSNSGIESSRAESSQMSEYVQYALIAGAVLVAWRYFKSKK
jgi:hypothetical protein